MNKKHLLTGFVGITGAVLLGLQASQNDASASTGKVSYQESATTVWTSPEDGQETVSYLAPNQEVEIKNTKKVFGKTWYQLDNGNWVNGDFVSVTNAPAAKKSAAKGKDIVTASYEEGAVTVWTSPESGKITGQYLPYKSSWIVVDTKEINNEKWYNVGKDAWVPAKYVALNNPSLAGVNTKEVASQPAQVQKPATQEAPAASTQAPASSQATSYSAPQATTNYTAPKAAAVTGVGAAAAVSAAKGQIGAPYVWGGTTPAGFDCSGLTQYAMAAAGKSIGRTTTSQEYAGTMIPVSQAQPGDLLFWGSRGATYHTAIYIGGGQYVHASVPGAPVGIEGISSYFMPSFAVRVF